MKKSYMDEKVRRFLDDDGRLKQLPAKHGVRMGVYSYLFCKFDPEAVYTEKEVNALLKAWSAYEDYVMLRRELVDYGFLCRTANGSSYWRNPNMPDGPRSDG